MLQFYVMSIIVLCILPSHSESSAKRMVTDGSSISKPSSGRMILPTVTSSLRNVTALLGSYIYTQETKDSFIIETKLGGQYWDAIKDPLPHSLDMFEQTLVHIQFRTLHYIYTLAWQTGWSGVGPTKMPYLSRYLPVLADLLIYPYPNQLSYH